MNAVTYNEVTLAGNRKYELYSDRIVISGVNTWSYQFEQTVLLTKISPEYIKVRMRPKLAWNSLTFSILTGLASIVLVYEFSIQSTAVPGVLGIFSGSALIVAIATMKRVEYAQFCSEGYASVLLNVARSGPDRNRFDSFVQAIVIGIEQAEKPHKAQPPDSKPQATN